MANWLQRLNIDEEREWAGNGEIEKAMKSVISRFKTIRYRHADDKAFHASTCNDLELLDMETDDDFDEMLYTLYEFGDAVSAGDPGRGFSMTQKLLWIEP